MLLFRDTMVKLLLKLTDEQKKKNVFSFCIFMMNELHFI